jgi:hypothetical protein
MLKALFEAKQKLNSLLLIKNIRAKGAREMLSKLTELVEQFANILVKTLSQTLKS